MADVADPEAEGRFARDVEGGVTCHCERSEAIQRQNKTGLLRPGAPRNDDREDSLVRNDLDPLILDMLEWLAREPRTYADVIDAWRTSCPRLTVWEDAIDRGFAVREHAKGREVMIALTAAGRAFLREHGRSGADTPNEPVITGLDPAIHHLRP